MVACLKIVTPEIFSAPLLIPATSSGRVPVDVTIVFILSYLLASVCRALSGFQFLVVSALFSVTVVILSFDAEDGRVSLFFFLLVINLIPPTPLTPVYISVLHAGLQKSISTDLT